jgi:RNA polymerase sigma factor (sigma-70 family)
MTTCSPPDPRAVTPRIAFAALTRGHDVPYHPPNRNLIQTHLASAVSGSTMTGAQVFTSELGLIERVILWVCARRSLRGADAEDFASTVKLRLIENDYEILARFEGRSSLKTYVTAVINRLYMDYQNQRFGKWRPSAQARRLGPSALRLECLLYRDGLTFEEASGVMQTHFGAAESRDALYDLSRELPVRSTRAAKAHHREPPDVSGGVSAIEQAERRALAEKTFAALRRALHRLSARDRIVLRLHVESGLSVADVARALGEEQKGLYRRRDALYKRLRLDLEAEGVHGRDARELLSTVDWDSALAAGAAGSGSLLEAAASPASPPGGIDGQEGEP